MSPRALSTRTLRTTLSLVLFLTLSGAALAATLGVEADGGGAYSTIQTALDAASPGDTVLLGPGVYTGAGNRDLTFYCAVTVQSSLGHAATTIDCQGSAASPHRAFVLTEEYSGSVVGLTIVNGWASDGAAVLTGWGEFVFEDCVFLDNVAGDTGGVMSIADGAEVVLSGCIFSNNSAANQGGVLYADGGAGYDVASCTFVRNRADEGGAVYLGDGATLLMDTSIIAFTRAGGAFDGYYFAGATFTCTDLYANTGGDWDNGAVGNGSNGNISADPRLRDPMAAPLPDVDLTLTSPCRAAATGCGSPMGAGDEISETEPLYGVKADGSGLFPTIQETALWVQNYGVVILEDAYYSGEGSGDLALYGVSLRSRGLDPATCTIDLTGQPGVQALFTGISSPNTDVTGITFTGGSLDSGALVSFVGEGTDVLVDCVFTGNYLYGTAQLMHIYSFSDTELDGCTFSDNIMDTTSPNAMIAVSGNASRRSTFNDCIFSGNWLTGPMITSDQLSLELNGCTLTDNTGPNLIHGEMAALEMTGTAVTGNTIGADDLVDVTGASVALVNCEILDNTSDSGMVRLSYSDVLVDLCLMRGNEAAANGGALYLRHCTGTVRDTRFESNTAEAHGGAVYLDVYQTMHYFNGAFLFDTCEFTGNHAPYDAALYAGVTGCYYYSCDDCSYQDLRLTLESCTFHANTAESGSGRAQIQANSEVPPEYTATGDLTLEVNHCLITDGMNAGIDAGFNSLSGGTVFCTDIHGNAGGDWDGTWLEAAFASPANVSFDPLYCDGAGGDLTLQGGSPCLAENSVCNVQVGANGQGCAGSVDVDDTPFAPGARITSNHPNPFNPSTTISFELAVRGAVSLQIYDLDGRLVRTLATGEMMDAGPQAMVWDGRTERGAVAGSGVYLARLRAGGDESWHKVMMLK